MYSMRLHTTLRIPISASKGEQQTVATVADSKENMLDNKDE